MKKWWETKVFNIKKTDLLWLILSVVFVFVLLRYQFKLIDYVVWYDESETIVATKMMANGSRLYIDIFNNHGPATFIIGYIISLLGDFNTQVYRIPVIIIQWLALLSIYFSPIHSKNKYKKLASIVLISTFWMLFLPFIYGHAYLYQTQSGLFFIIIFMQYALPIYLGKELNKFQKFIGPFLLVFIPFFAITNVPMVGLIFLTTIRKKDGLIPWIAYVLSLSVNLGFLISFGSVDGFIAYHIYLNAVILNDGNGIGGYVRNIITYYRENFANFLTLSLLLIMVYQITKRSNGLNILRALLIIPMLVSLVIRGGQAFDLWGLIYLYVLSSLSMVFFLDTEQERIFDQWPLLLVFILGFYSLYRTSFIDEHMYIMPSTTPAAEIAKRITSKDEPILALTFRNYEYLMADRLPASAHFYYLEMQANYYKNPYKNIQNSLIDDIKKKKPKLIVMDEWSSTSTPFKDYAHEVWLYVLENYNQVNYSDIYVRKDIDLSKFGIDPITGVLLN